MKTILIFRAMMILLMAMFLLNLIGCSNGKGGDPGHYYGVLTINGFQFTQNKQPAFYEAVESSIVSYQGKIEYIVDIGMNGNMSVGQTQSEMITVSQNERFSYVFEHNGTYYNVTTKNHGVYLSRSTDLYSWIQMNGGSPIMTESPGTIYGTLWNASIAIDSNGLWHMLVECETNGNNNLAGLGYSTASLVGNNINFNAGRSAAHVISKAGNAWMTFVPNRGMLIVYGKVNTPTAQFGNEWYVTAATMENGVFTENANFTIGRNSIHIADPHVLETSEGLTMSLSYDQYSVYELKSTQSITQFYDSVKN